MDKEWIILISILIPMVLYITIMFGRLFYHDMKYRYRCMVNNCLTEKRSCDTLCNKHCDEKFDHYGLSCGKGY